MSGWKRSKLIEKSVTSFMKLPLFLSNDMKNIGNDLESAIK